jgi:hypothetical protein
MGLIWHISARYCLQRVRSRYFTKPSSAPACCHVQPFSRWRCCEHPRIMDDSISKSEIPWTTICAYFTTRRAQERSPERLHSTPSWYSDCANLAPLKPKPGFATRPPITFYAAFAFSPTRRQKPAPRNQVLRGLSFPVQYFLMAATAC